MRIFLLSLIAFALSFIFITAFPPWLAGVAVTITWLAVLVGAAAQ